MPKGNVSERRTSAELKTFEAALPKAMRGCGHVGVLPADYYSERHQGGQDVCLECYREQERDRQRKYREGVTPATLKGAGHAPAPDDGKITRLKHPKRQEAMRLLREARADEKETAAGYVYCIGEEGHDFAVKIGKSAAHPQSRLAGLQTGNPRKLVLLGFIKSKDRHKAEARLHKRFIKANILQEWFRPEPALFSFFNITPAPTAQADPKEVVTK